MFGINGKNLIETMIDVGKTHDEVRVVTDQIGTLTYIYDLARLLIDMCGTEKYGYYYAINAEVIDKSTGCKIDYINWYDFCCKYSISSMV